MSFLGNFAAAQGAKAIGQYQKSIWDNEANYIIAQRNQKRTVFDQVLKPQLLDIQDSQYSDFFVQSLRTGAEIRPGTTPYFNLLKFKTNQAFDLAMADFNDEVDYNSMTNKALITRGKGEAALYTGLMTARTETIKGYGSLLSEGYSVYSGGG
jgi:hypothetical protein